MNLLNLYIKKFQPEDIPEAGGYFGNEFIPYKDIRVIEAEVYEETTKGLIIYELECSIRNNQYIKKFTVKMDEKRALNFLGCLSSENMPPTLFQHIKDIYETEAVPNIS